MWLWFYQLASPPHAYRLLGLWRPWLMWPALVLMAIGVYGGLMLAPPDYQQKDAFRIIYVHVPSASISLMIYVMMAVAAAIGVIWRMKLAHAVAAGCAPLGAWMTALSLVTGSIWGRPMWGTWWEWDGRLTSMLILFFLYLGHMALLNAFEDSQRGYRAAAILALVGVVNIPIIKFSVDWWSTLHQPASVLRLDGPTIHPSMLWPLLIVALGFKLYYVTVVLLRMKSELVAARLRALDLAVVKGS